MRLLVFGDYQCPVSLSASPDGLFIIVIVLDLRFNGEKEQESGGRHYCGWRRRQFMFAGQFITSGA